MPARRSHRLVQLESKRTAAAAAAARTNSPTPTPAARRTTSTPSPTGSPRSSSASAPSLTRSPLSTSDGTSLPSPVQDEYPSGNCNSVKEPTASALMPPPPLPTHKTHRSKSTTTTTTVASDDGRKRKRAGGDNGEHTGDTTDDDDHDEPSSTAIPKHPPKTKSHRKTKTSRPASSSSTTTTTTSKHTPPSPKRQPKPRPPRLHPSRGPPPNLPSATTHCNLDLFSAAANWLEHRDASGGDASFASRLYAHSTDTPSTPVAAYVRPVYADSTRWRGAWEARRARAAAAAVELDEEGAEVLGVRVGPAPAAGTRVGEGRTAYRAGSAGGAEVGISEVVSAGAGREVTLWFAAEAGWEVAARKARARAEGEAGEGVVGAAKQDQRETECGLGRERERERARSERDESDDGGRGRTSTMAAENYANGHHGAVHQHSQCHQQQQQQPHLARAHNYCHA